MLSVRVREGLAELKDIAEFFSPGATRAIKRLE